MRAASSSPSTPAARKDSQCARLPRTSASKSRRSKPNERLYRANAGSVSPRKRPPQSFLDSLIGSHSQRHSYCESPPGTRPRPQRFSSTFTAAGASDGLRRCIFTAILCIYSPVMQNERITAGGLNAQDEAAAENPEPHPGAAHRHAAGAVGDAGARRIRPGGVKVTERKIKKIVLAYSGGLDTSVMLRWLREEYGCEVVCYCADVGQGEELAGLEEKARATGASKLYVEDLRREFVEEYVWTAVKANAVYEGVYLLGTSLARPVIAKRQIEIARREGADAVAHGATGKGNDQVRFELTYYALEPDIRVVAPWREWEFKGRSDLIAYAKEHNIPVTATAEKPYSTDRNLMHISYEGGILEDPWADPPADIFRLTKSPESARAEAEYIEIGFEKGDPVSINGKHLDAVAMLR